MIDLRAIRKRRGLKQRQVGEMLGITESGYCLIEQGKRSISPATAMRLGEILGFNWTELYEDGGKPNMDRFIVKTPIHKQNAQNGMCHVRVTPEAYAVLSSICVRTAQPLSKIATMAILFAAEHLDIVDSDEEDEEIQ